MKTIMPDPVRLFRYGVRNLMDLAILVHIGRCGLTGARVGETAALLEVDPHTVWSGIRRLRALKMVTKGGQMTRPGSPHWFVVTVGGWELLTDAPDYSPYGSGEKEMQPCHE